MKKLILIALISVGAWGYYTKNERPINATVTKLENSKPAPAIRNLPNYQCDGRQHCSQMGSYEEAKYFIEHCPNTKMDGDGDGIPCERQFGH